VNKLHLVPNLLIGDMPLAEMWLSPCNICLIPQFNSLASWLSAEYHQ